MPGAFPPLFVDICSTLILAAILGEVLRFAMGVHSGPQSSFTHVGGEITPSCRGFQNTVCACLSANEPSMQDGC